MPADLVGAVEAIGDICADETTDGDKALPYANSDKENASAEKIDRDLSPRERESLLKLVIGMAIKGYAHDPSKFRNGTAKVMSLGVV